MMVGARTPSQERSSAYVRLTDHRVSSLLRASGAQNDKLVTILSSLWHRYRIKGYCSWLAYFKGFELLQACCARISFHLFQTEKSQRTCSTLQYRPEGRRQSQP